MAVKLLAAAAILGAAGTAALNVVDKRREDAAEAAYPPVGQIVMVGKIRIRAVVMGEGPDLVLIHGASGSIRDMTFDFAPELAKHYRVIVFDRPGMGYSDHTDPVYAGAWATTAESPAEQAVVLQAAAAQLGAEKPIVLGHSYGGAVALAWALERPNNIAALVDVSGVSNPWPDPLDWLYRVNGTSIGGALFPPLLTAFISDNYVRQVVDGIFAPQPPTPGYDDFIGAGLSLRRDAIRANARQVNTLLPHIRKMVPRYGEIHIPVEIIHGDADTIVPLAIHSIPLEHEIAGAHLVVLPGIGHMPHHVAMPAVIAAVDRAATRAGLR
ncbi:MAG: alpha/beta fold hydrolase [Limimaricola sp.]|nr:alpha/beta hydrolase [Limimaricola sp.]MBI1418140.1 alpha/beta fold hydrolase [Limimaricola sp.]